MGEGTFHVIPGKASQSSLDCLTKAMDEAKSILDNHDSQFGLELRTGSHRVDKAAYREDVNKAAKSLVPHKLTVMKAANFTAKSSTNLSVRV